MTQDVIQGTFSDLKLIKTRSVAQIVIEVPIEAADHALSVLGGVPQAGKECSVAVARLNLGRSHKAAWPSGLGLAPHTSPSQEAGMYCTDSDFQEFLVTPTEDGAAAKVRAICKVPSRRVLDQSESAAKAWDTLKHDFYGWMNEKDGDSHDESSSSQCQGQ